MNLEIALHIHIFSRIPGGNLLILPIFNTLMIPRQYSIICPPGKSTRFSKEKCQLHMKRFFFNGLGAFYWFSLKRFLNKLLISVYISQ